MTTSDEDHIAKIIKASGDFYERELLSYLRLLGLRGECAVDVGANIGNHSIFFAAFLAEKIISIEANKDLVPILRENLSANGCQYEIIAAAIGSENGPGRISYPLENNIGAGKIIRGAGDINIITLDQAVPRKGVFLIKIDVEGMEMDVLKGATQLIEAQYPDLVIEASTAAEFHEIDAFLRSFGYRCLSKWNSTPTYHFSFNHGAFIRLKVATIKAYIKAQRLINHFRMADIRR